MTSHRLLAALVLCGVAGAVQAQAEARKGYIVQLAESPAATYPGGLAGLPATRPAKGARLQADAPQVQNYLRFLQRRQSQVLAATAPGAPVYHRYGLVFNGFAVKLSERELQKLAADPNVVAITADEPRPLDTSYTPTFLGMDGPQGAWSRLDAAGRAIKGEGVIIGHVDGGVWPENPSFSDKVDGSGKPVPY